MLEKQTKGSIEQEEKGIGESEPGGGESNPYMISGTETKGDPSAYGDSIFNLQELLDRLMGDEALARTVLNLFFEDMPAQIQALQEMLKKGDRAGAHRQSHTIKGASASVGGAAMRRIAYEMEKAGEAGNLGRITALMPEMERQFGMLRDAIDKELRLRTL